MIWLKGAVLSSSWMPAREALVLSSCITVLTEGEPDSYWSEMTRRVPLAMPGPQLPVHVSTPPGTTFHPWAERSALAAATEKGEGLWDSAPVTQGLAGLRGTGP